MPQPSTHREAASSVGYPLRGLLGIVATAALLFYFLAPNAGSWNLALARREFDRNPALALKYVNDALQQDPDDPQAHFMRVRLLEANNDAAAALGAINDALSVRGLRALPRQNLLLRRVEILQRLDKHQAAINDAQQMVAIGPVDSDDAQFSPFSSSSLHNLRAYTIARAAAARQASPEQLATAKADMNITFAALAKHRSEAARRGVSLSLDYWQNEAMYLDTLGYLEFTAGDHRQALRDLNRAVQLCDLIDQMLQRNNSAGAQELQRARQGLRTTRAVLMHHRGEVLMALGNTAEGQLNIKLAKLQGYSREHGNW